MCLTSLQFDVTLAAMNYWKSICRMRSPAGPDGTQIKWPSSFPSWELQRGSERNHLPATVLNRKHSVPYLMRTKGHNKAAEG